VVSGVGRQMNVLHGAEIGKGKDKLSRPTWSLSLTKIWLQLEIDAFVSLYPFGA